jgi:hypothetical protein
MIVLEGPLSPFPLEEAILMTVLNPTTPRPEILCPIKAAGGLLHVGYAQTEDS